MWASTTGGAGQRSPGYGIVYRGLRNSIIKDNVLQHGAVIALMHDLGGNDAATIVRDNSGQLAE